MVGGCIADGTSISYVLRVLCVRTRAYGRMYVWSQSGGCVSVRKDISP